MNKLWYDVIVAVSTGLFTSFLFLIMTFILRPKMKISKCIAQTEANGQIVYKIKVVNCSYLFKIIDVKVELCVLSKYTTPGGMNTKIRELKMGKDHIWYISQRTLGKSQTAPYAILFATMEDLKSVLESEKDTLHFKVIAKHGLSGFPKIQTMQYFDLSNSIKKGKFEHGKPLAII